MAWFRFYDEVVDDPKVQRLPLILFRAWVNFMCVSKQSGGVLPDIKDIAYKLHITIPRAEQFFAELKDARLIDQREDGQFEMHNWPKRQFHADVSTERVKRFRKRHETVSGNGSKRLHETDQRQNRTETDTDNPQAPILELGEFKRAKLTQGQFDKLKAELNGHLDDFIARFDRWVNDAPEAKKDGVRRKDRHAYESILSWFHKDVSEGRLAKAAKKGFDPRI